MLPPVADSPASNDSLAAESIATVRRWLAESSAVAPDRSAERLAGMLKDPKGLDFAIGFVDRVIRPQDLRVAGRNLEVLSRSVPAFLPWYMSVAIQLGGGFAPLLPWPIVPIARRVLRGMVGHLILDASPERLDRSISRLRTSGIRLNLNLLGEAVLGDEEADARLAGTRKLLERDDVDYVSIKVSSISSQLSMWSFEEAVAKVVNRLAPLYEFAAASATRKFINLDMEEFRDLDLTIEVFRRLLDGPRLKNLEAGIVLQAYLPDALGALRDLTAWATERRLAGGAGVKVRVVKGANLAMERVDATLHGWPVATWDSKRETDANYKRMLDWALTPERTDAVRIGVAGHNLFDIAYAWLLAKQRRVESRVEFEMLLGMTTGQADAVRRDVGGLLLYTPVVHPGEFDSAISYLIRRLEENSSSENFMSGVFELGSNPEIFEREAGRFLASIAVQDDPVPASHRVQDRSEVAALHPIDTAPRPFTNEPDTDPSIDVNREWGRQILERVASSQLGVDAVAAAHVRDAETLAAIISSTAISGSTWGERRADTRAAVLHSVAESLSAARARLIEVMASETGKTIAEGDVEVSEAIDFANYYAEQARELDHVTGADFVPSRLTVVTPPWNFPVAIPAGSMLAALAAGSAVIIKPAPQARRCAAVLVEALWAGGVPRDILAMVDVDEGELGRQLVSDPAVDRVILTGAWETAQLFRSWRSDLPLLAETSGKNAIVVTPSADFDLAVADIVKSAFGHAGQKCSAASLVILVGSVASSERFRRQLIDAVTSLRVGYPQHATTTMGPLIEPAAGKLRKALTTLDPGELWLVQPRALDESDRLWSPGVKENVAPGSEFHLTEYFGPVLGIMHAKTLTDAIELQNAPSYGLTAGLYSLDGEEIELWIDRVQAGNLYVNRGITGAIVRRQPFGGWKRSSVGTSAKAGGPDYLLTLGDWMPVFSEPVSSVVLAGLSDGVASVIEAAQQGMEFLEFDRVRAGAVSDERVWQAQYGATTDVSGLVVERNLYRYRPVPVHVRLAEGASPAQLVRVITAATRAGAPISISSAVPVAAGLVRLFSNEQSPVTVEEVVVESDSRWRERVQVGQIGVGDGATGRIRLIGGSAKEVAKVLAGDPDVAVYSGPVTTSGRIEMLPFLTEQSITITAHRFGNPDSMMAIS